MHTVKLAVSSVTSNGGAHCNLVIDGQDTGVLYLSKNEKDIMVKLLRDGSLGHDSVVFEFSDTNDEFDYDVFD